MYRARRRHLLWGVLLAVVLGYWAGQLLNDTGHAVLSGAGTQADHRGPRLPSISWPAQGQAALVLGGDQPAASPNEQPVPIASVAKVMTAYLVLQRHPLSDTEDGFAVTITDAQVQDEIRDQDENQSGVRVAVGEQLTERQMLEAMLIPSGNNVARILADQVAGNETAFVAQMNAEARALGMEHTKYTDPSGWDQGTVSTAADQLRVFRAAMRFPVFRQIVSMPSARLPVAGTVTNFDPLVGEGYGGKTGSDSAAGGCLAFFTQVTVGGHPVTVTGVVLGQGQGSNTKEILGAAGATAQALVQSAVSARATTGAPAAPGRTAAPVEPAA